MFQDLQVSAFLAGRSLRRGSKGALLLTIAIIALVFVNLIFLPSIVQGVIVSFDRQAVSYLYGNLALEPREGEVSIPDADALVRKVGRIPGITAAAARLTTGASITFGKRSITSQVTGVDPGDEARVLLTATRLTGGTYLSEGDTDVAVIGTTIAGDRNERLDDLDSLGGAGVGDLITVAYPNGQIRKYRVKGIFETEAVNADSAVYVTRRELATVLGAGDRASQVLVRTATTGDEESYRNLLYSFGIGETVRTWQEKSRSMLGDISDAFAVINLISTLVSLVIAVVVIFIVVYISTMNRRRQIGILKAMGIDRGLIVNSYVLQVIFMCLVGTGLGLAILSVLVYLLNLYPLRIPGGPIYPAIEAEQVLQSMVSLFLVSVVAGFVPAWRTASEDILSAIRG
ncbi:MAG: ABC transporter permease [Methanospirillum sp.]|nr:ABC transporter permease [Methanospirillum sp.]